MGLSQALGAAVSGLRVTQSRMSLVAANVANAETAGYIKKTLSQVTTQASGSGVSVRVSAVNRELDVFLQRQLRIESSGASYAGTRAQFYERLQGIYGQAGSEAALETVYNKFTSSLQALRTSPDSASARTDVLSTAMVLVQQLNAMTDDIQSLRLDAELGLAAAVQQANAAMTQIAHINTQIATLQPTDASTAALLDQRDLYVDQLAQLMDIRVIEGNNNQIDIFTGSGVQLVGTQASLLQFNAQGNVSPASAWNRDSQLSTLGTIVLKSPNGGGDIDLLSTRAINSGQIAALVEMRDFILPEAQAQLDEIAATLARSLSDLTAAGTAVTSGAQAGFQVDTAGLIEGNTIHLSYTDTATNSQREVTIVRVDDPSLLPLANSDSANPNDRVIGVDFSGGMASVVAQLNSALGYTGLQFSNPSGTLLDVLDDGLGHQVNVDAMSTTKTVTSLTAGMSELPFFQDGGAPYSGAITSLGSQSIGLAGRISVNRALVADPSRLVVYQTTPMTAAGDDLRPTFMYDQLTSASFVFSPGSGVGTTGAPFSGSLAAFMRQVVNQQGEAAATAGSLRDGQSIVVSNLQQRFDTDANVNIDEEMATLLQLQTAYGANARVMTAIRDMLEALMNM